MPEPQWNMATQVFASPEITIFLLMNFRPNVTLIINLEMERMEWEIINSTLLKKKIREHFNLTSDLDD